ncbi:MAG: WbqC family protein [Bacteroidota bacterium]|uniref:WbqC-like protein family protein n=1 Tax=Algoriphagus faecimaris TaxID=686796 RepID=A0A1G6MIE3_9BACT|nr:WbqC family protein [Algoriphagus faecimaris]SDC55260.1 WbqC-like protein family protein [Algoriphagus faecimaris]
MSKIAIDLQYLPNLEFFCAIWEAEELWLCAGDTYQRKSWFNRTQIRLSNKVEMLSVPIVGRRPRVSLGSIKVDYQQKWQKNHLRGIQSGYGKAPFFEYFFPEIEGVFQKQTSHLWELNLEFLTICLKLLQRPVKLRVVENSEIEGVDTDLRGLLKPGEPFLERSIYQAVPYQQLFGLDFEPNLSVLDLLFCEGPSAGSIIRKSIKKE